MTRTQGLLLITLMLNQVACEKKDETVDASIPQIASVSISARTANSFAISWPAATDDSTSANSLEYKVVYSVNNNLTSADDAIVNGTTVLDWTANITSGNLSSLQQSKSYYIAVLVRDTDSKIGFAGAATSTLCSGKRMYLASVPNGNLGGISGADTVCTNAKPSGFGTVKAMISSNAANPNSRSACNTTATPPGTGGESCTGSNLYTQNWVLAANASICSADYEARIGITNAFATMTTIEAGVLSASPTATFTGMNIAWGQASGINCSNWTSTSGNGYSGSAASNGSGFISAASISCASAGTIYCVEQ